MRSARTRAFLELFKPGLQYDVVPIADVYGPTAWDPAVDALVVSKETLPGAASSKPLPLPPPLSSRSTGPRSPCAWPSPQAPRRERPLRAAHLRDRRHLRDGGERRRRGRGPPPQRQDEQHLHPPVDRPARSARRTPAAGETPAIAVVVVAAAVVRERCRDPGTNGRLPRAFIRSFIHFRRRIRRPGDRHRTGEV